MPFSNSKPSLISSSQSSAGSVKGNAAIFQYAGTQDKNPAWPALATALGNIQNQLDTVFRILRSGVGLPNPIQVTDKDGNLVLQIGDFVGPNEEALSGISASVYYQNGIPVPGPPSPGWSAPTGTISRASFDQSTVTLPELAQRLAALIEDLETQGILIP